MEAKLKLTYHRGGDILSIDLCEPYVGQKTDEIDSGMVAHFNPKTGEVENLEIMSWSKRLESGEGVVLPLLARLRLAVEA